MSVFVLSDNRIFFPFRGTAAEADTFLAELTDTSPVCGSSAGDAVEGVDGRSVGVYQ